MHLTELKPLVGAVTPQQLGRLSRLNVRHIEQVGSLLVTPEGRYALGQLGFDTEQLQSLVEPALKKQFGLSITHPLQEGDKKRPPLLNRHTYQMGYASSDDPFRDATLGSILPDPPVPEKSEKPEPPAESPRKHEHILKRDGPFAARDQGRRGTCVAFTVTGMYHYARLKGGASVIDLSPQYLYYRTRTVNDPPFHPDEDGTSIVAALTILRQHGCCLDSHLRYVPRHDIRQAYTVVGHSPNRDEDYLKTNAKLYKITEFRTVEHTVEAVKKELHAGNAVAVGIAVYQLAWQNNRAESHGEIALPLFDDSGAKPILLDTYLGGHAVLIIGYRDNEAEDEEGSHRPGGGSFIFCNSWGDSWAASNPHARGYGNLPYEYLTRFCLEAAVIDGLKPPPSKSAPGGQKGSKIGTKVTTKTGPKSAKRTRKK